jgi:hypothetical protein
MSEGLQYSVGETIVLTAIVGRPDTKQAVDPDSIIVESFTKAGANVPLAEYSFTRIETGKWEIDLTSSHLDVGTYQYSVRVNGDLGVTVSPDVLVIIPRDTEITDPPPM